MTIESSVTVPQQAKELDTAQVSTGAGPVHRQVVVLGDPDNPDQRLPISGGKVSVQVENTSLPVSVATLPLPTGAATSTKQDSTNTKLDAIAASESAIAVSVASVDTKLTSQATAANQVAAKATSDAILAKIASAGTAGTPSANVLTVQGVAGGMSIPIETGGAVLDVLNHSLPILRGEIAGRAFNRKFAYNGSIGTTETTIWTDTALVVPYLAAAQTITLSSTSANDTSAGTGARTVFINGLDGSYNSVSETVTLNGTTAVTTTTSFLRVQRMWTITAGSTGSNVGNVYAGYGTVTGGKPVSVLAHMSPLLNQAAFSVYTVPAGKTAYLIDLFSGVNSGEGELRVYVRPFGGVWRNRGRYPFINNNVTRDYGLAFEINEKEDFDIRAIAKSGTITCGIEYAMILIDN